MVETLYMRVNPLHERDLFTVCERGILGTSLPASDSPASTTSSHPRLQRLSPQHLRWFSSVDGNVSQFAGDRGRSANGHGALRAGLPDKLVLDLLEGGLVR